MTVLKDRNIIPEKFSGESIEKILLFKEFVEW